MVGGLYYQNDLNHINNIIMRNELYKNIWKGKVATICDALKNHREKVCVMNREVFTAVGNRQKYDFRITFENGQVTNDLSGTAVARDLEKALQEDRVFKNLSANRKFKIKMNSDYELLIEYLDNM